MVSNTKQTKNKRRSKLKRGGRRRKRLARAGTTPAFPIQPPGYDPSAPDAKGSASEKSPA